MSIGTPKFVHTKNSVSFCSNQATPKEVSEFMELNAIADEALKSGWKTQSPESMAYEFKNYYVNCAGKFFGMGKALPDGHAAIKKYENLNKYLKAHPNGVDELKEEYTSFVDDALNFLKKENLTEKAGTVAKLVVDEIKKYRKYYVIPNEFVEHLKTFIDGK